MVTILAKITIEGKTLMENNDEDNQRLLQEYTESLILANSQIWGQSEKACQILNQSCYTDSFAEAFILFA